MVILYKTMILLHELSIKAMLMLYHGGMTIKLPLLSDHELMVIR